MSEESKASAEETGTPVEPEETNYVSGDVWVCKGCGISNKISNWKCIACFASLKKSMQKEKALKQREQRKSEARARQRAKRREALRAGKKTSGDDDDKTANEAAEEAAAGTDGSAKESESDLKFKLSRNIPKTMRALIKEKSAKGFQYVQDYPVPTPKEDELLIRSFAVSVSASDSVLYNWSKDAQRIAKTPFIPGSEAAGLVVGVGKACRFRIGERVAIENHFFCSDCYYCDMNRKDICCKLQQFGRGKGTIYGGCCDYFTVKEKYCYLIKADISWRDSALLQPLGTAYNACMQADLDQKPMGRSGGGKMNKSRQMVTPKQTVLVMGCGSIGCMAIAVAKTMAMTGQVVAVDMVDKRLAVATKMGADVVINPKTLKGSLKDELMKLTDGVGVGRVIECSGNVSLINQMFDFVRSGACVSLVGLPREALKIENPVQNIIMKSVQIRSVSGRRIFRTWNRTERLVADGKINLDPVVSYEMSLSEFETAYKLLGSGDALRVVFNLTK